MLSNLKLKRNQAGKAAEKTDTASPTCSSIGTASTVTFHQPFASNQSNVSSSTSNSTKVADIALSTTVPKIDLNQTPWSKIQWNALLSSLNSPEGTILAYNFLRELSKIPNFDEAWSDGTWRMVPVQLISLWTKYRIAYSDMALDLAAVLYFILRVQESQPQLWRHHEIQRPKYFHVQVVWYLAYLAHVYHQDRTIKLADWAQGLDSKRFFDKGIVGVNRFVLSLMGLFCNWKLRVSASLLRPMVEVLCTMPKGGSVTANVTAKISTEDHE
eukprot:Platyproteum_vivax@DN2939_c0_g1_i1.p1